MNKSQLSPRQRSHTRFLPAAARLWLVATFLAACTLPAQARKQPAVRHTLSFTVSAHLVAGAGGQAQNYLSRVWTKGNEARIETSFSERPMVFLVTPPYVYKLIPAAQAGLRWRSARLAASTAPNGGFDLQTLLSDPAAIRSLLRSKGAVRQRSVRMGRANVDVYAVHHPANSGRGAYSATAYLRQGDALPLRLNFKAGSLAGTVLWSNYIKDVAQPESLFRAPNGYHIRSAQGEPSLFAF